MNLGHMVKSLYSEHTADEICDYLQDVDESSISVRICGVADMLPQDAEVQYLPVDSEVDIPYRTLLIRNSLELF